MESERAKWRVLNNATELRASSTWSGVYISPDLTAKERDANKKLRDEL